MILKNLDRFGETKLAAIRSRAMAFRSRIESTGSDVIASSHGIIAVKRDGKTLRKSDLPSKVCPVCSRPFTWRKKWERDWDQVIYCSDRCRRQGVQVEV